MQSEIAVAIAAEVMLRVISFFGKASTRKAVLF
jgi:hypothetical protein